MIVTINITAEIIAKNCHNAFNCPVAEAFRAVFPTLEIGVNHDSLAFYPTRQEKPILEIARYLGCHPSFLPLFQWVTEYDNKGLRETASFTVELPDSLAQYQKDVSCEKVTNVS